MNPQKKVILFDLDHTLIDTTRIRNDWLKVLERFGVARKDAERMSKRMLQGEAIFDPTLALSLVAHAPHRKAAKATMDEMYRAFEKYNFDGIGDLLAPLSRKYALVLLSYGHRPYQMLKFKQSGLQGFFTKAVITSNLHKKEDLIAFRKKYGDDVLLVDDSLTVARAARGAGVKVVWIRRGHKDAAYYKNLLQRIEKALR